MMNDFQRLPFVDSTNIPRPSRRPCAAPSGVSNPVGLQKCQKATVGQSSPISDRPLSPLGSATCLSPPRFPPNTGLSVPQIYERMKTIMLEMNMLMAQWEVALRPQCGVHDQPSHAEAFNAMLNTFDTISSQYELYLEAHRRSSSEMKQSGPHITTVRQSADCARSSTVTPAKQHERAIDSSLSDCPTAYPCQYKGVSVPPSKVKPAGAPDLDKDCIVAVVEFKRQRTKRFACVQFFEPGQYVLVDGDRGQDCGFVVYCSVRNPDGTQGLTQSIDNVHIDVSRIKIEHGIVRGLASNDDISRLHGEIAANERLALKTCRDLVEQMNLPMKIVDCEFQFDRRKISFYFESDRSIDFRALTTELYRIFGVRIWLENQNNKVKNLVPDGAHSHSERTSCHRS